MYGMTYVIFNLLVNQIPLYLFSSRGIWNGLENWCFACITSLRGNIYRHRLIPRSFWFICVEKCTFDMLSLLFIMKYLTKLISHLGNALSENTFPIYWDFHYAIFNHNDHTPVCWTNHLYKITNFIYKKTRVD